MQETLGKRSQWEREEGCEIIEFDVRNSIYCSTIRETRFIVEKSVQKKIDLRNKNHAIFKFPLLDL